MLWQSIKIFNKYKMETLSIFVIFYSILKYVNVNIFLFFSFFIVFLIDWKSTFSKLTCFTNSVTIFWAFDSFLTVKLKYLTKHHLENLLLLFGILSILL